MVNIYKKKWIKGYIYICLYGRQRDDNDYGIIITIDLCMGLIDHDYGIINIGNDFGYIIITNIYTQHDNDVEPGIDLYLYDK